MYTDGKQKRSIFQKMRIGDGQNGVNALSPVDLENSKD
jgi:hypothetical protein